MGIAELDCRIGICWLLCYGMVWFGMPSDEGALGSLTQIFLLNFSCWHSIRACAKCLAKFFYERACWRSIRGEAPLSFRPHNSRSADCLLQNILVTSALLGHLFSVSSGARLCLCLVACALVRPKFQNLGYARVTQGCVKTTLPISIWGLPVWKWAGRRKNSHMGTPRISLLVRDRIRSL